MKNNKTIFAAIILCAGIVASCAVKPARPYTNMREFPANEPPRMVYVDDQVGPLITNGPVPEGRTIFVDVRTIDGRHETGKLLQITEKAVYMSSGLGVKTMGGVAPNKENEISFPKEEIVILKIW